MKYLLNNYLRIFTILILMFIFVKPLYSAELEIPGKSNLSNIKNESLLVNSIQDFVVSGIEINYHFPTSPRKLKYTKVSTNNSTSQLSYPAIILRNQINNKYQELTGGQDVP